MDSFYANTSWSNVMHLKSQDYLTIYKHFKKVETIDKTRDQVS